MLQPLPRTSDKNRLLSQAAHELQPRRLLPTLTAGLIVGLLVIVFTISLASLVFAGSLSGFVSIGIVLALFGAMIIGMVVTWFSSYSGTIAAPQEAPAAILALMAVSISNSMPANSTPEEAFLTVVAAVVLTSISAGLLFLILGYFELGELVRFLPYPVVGGFLAGTGWLLVTGAITVMTDVAPDLSAAPVLFRSDMWLRWLPALTFAILLLVVVNRYHHFLIMPAMIVGAVAVFHFVMWVTNTSIAELSAQGWLLQPPEQGLSLTFTYADLNRVNWQVLGGQIGNAATVLVISAVALLLNASGLELVVREDIDLSHELQTAGIGNVISGLGGGLVGFHLLSESSLSYKIGARGRLAGVIAAVACGLVLLWGTSVLYLFPKPVLGSLLIMLGLSFLVEWVYQAWFKFSRIDYLIITAILIVIAVVGFLQGVALGVVLAVVLFVVNYSRVNVVKHSLSGANYQSRVTRPRLHRELLGQHGGEIHILKLQGFIFFGTAHNLLNQVRRRIETTDGPRLRFVVLDFREVTGLDSTATLSFAKMKQLAESQQIVLILTSPAVAGGLPGQSDNIARFFAQMGNVAPGEAKRIVRIFPDLDRGLEWCENQILLEAGVSPGDDPESLRGQLQSMLPDATDLDALMQYFERLEVGAEHYLMKQGDLPDDLYFIESGQVTAQLEFPGTLPVRLETMRCGRVVGEIGFYLNTPRTAAVVTDEPSTIYRLTKRTLQRMEQTDPQAASAFHQVMIRLVAERLTHLINTVHALQR